MTAPDEHRRSSEARPKRRTWRQRLVRTLLLYVVTPYVVVCAVFFVLQRKFLYPATRVEAIRIADGGLSVDEARDVRLSTEDGVALHGWLVKRVRDADAGVPREPLLVLRCPGNSGNRLDRVADCRELARLGCDVLLFDYRGYGDNAGSPGEDRFASDAHDIWNYAIRDLSYSPQQIVIFGESIGGAVAVRLAAKICDAGTPPAGLILSSTFASLPETVQWHYPYFPFHWMLLDRYPSVERIGRVACPILQLHGTRDDFIPIEHARRLFAAAPRSSSSGIPRRFVELRGSSHNELPVAVFRRELVDFLAAVRAHSP